MTFALSAVVPHPPIIIPEVGGSETTKVAQTIESLTKLGKELARRDIDTLLFTSPHSPFDNAFFLLDDKKYLKGALSNFGYPEIGFEVEENTGLSKEILRLSDASGVSVGVRESIGSGSGFMDHGIIVPYYYLSMSANYKMTSLSISGLPLIDHFEFGKIVGRAIDNLGEKIAFIASGDLSHGLTKSAPIGLAKRGREFDELIIEKIGSGKIRDLVDIDDDLVSNAAECGLRSIVMLAGALDGRRYDSKVRSYEGPFGVGYMVAEMAMV